MRLKIRAGSARKCRRANSFEMSVAGPNRPAFEFCDVFSVGSRLSPQFPSQSLRRPCPSDAPDLRSADRVGLLKPAGSLPALLLVVAACRSSTWPPQISPTLRALILNLSTVRQAESHI